MARQAEVALTPLDLSLSQYRCLMFLAEGSSAATALAGMLAVSPPSVTSMVDGLVSRGLVERRSEPGDRRLVTHVLTDDGARILKQADKALQARLDEISAFLRAEDAATAERGLELWNEALDAYRASKMETKG